MLLTCFETTLVPGGGLGLVSLLTVAHDEQHLGELAWRIHSSETVFVDGLGYHH